MTCSMLSPIMAMVEVAQYRRYSGTRRAGKRTAGAATLACDTAPPGKSLGITPIVASAVIDHNAHTPEASPRQVEPYLAKALRGTGVAGRAARPRVYCE